MPTRIRLLSLVLAALVISGPLRAANLDGSSPEVGNAEAVRLYVEANDFVTNMAERQYSYDYLQFYWKRAQSNIDRIRRVYPDSPTSQSLARGDLKIGPFKLDYFKERVLYDLELKRLGAYDDVNCAIFLYGLDPNRNDAIRDGTLEDIVEVLARRQRWGEALRFPVLTVHRPLLLRSIFRIAALYDQKDIMRLMMKTTTPGEREKAGFDPILAEALALGGGPRSDLYKFVADHPTDAVRSAALAGVIERDMLIRHAEAAHVQFTDSVTTVHLVARHVSHRDNIPEVAAEIYAGTPGEAAPLLAVYNASIGTAPDEGAGVDARLAFMRFLADARRFDALGSYAADARLSGSDLDACELKAIELFAEAGRTEDAERARKEYSQRGDAEANAAALAEFRGRMDDYDDQLVARTDTFAEVPITDPCVMATAIMDWSLTPNRSQRGATPWDAVVAKFAGGFDNLPKPKSAEVGDAASTLKPY
jgi:hypothetical protein